MSFKKVPSNPNDSMILHFPVRNVGATFFVLKSYTSRCNQKSNFTSMTSTIILDSIFIQNFYSKYTFEYICGNGSLGSLIGKMSEG